MNVAKLLQAVDEVIFEVACLAVLLPKTFFLLSFSPRKAHAYVAEEQQKKSEERYDRFTSPLIFWSIVGILPHFMVLSLFSTNERTSQLLAVNVDDLLVRMLKLSPDVRFVALSAFAVSLPLAFAVVIARERKQLVGKAALREPLYTLCYCTAPIFLAATPIWGIWIQQLSGADPETTQAEFNVYAMALVLWTAWVGAALLRLNLGIGWRRALVLLGKTYLMFFGLMLLLEVGILMILGTLIMGPH